MLWRKISVLSAFCIIAVGAAGAAVQAPDDLRERIRQAEYEFTSHGGSYFAPNRAQGFRSRLDVRGLEMTDRLKGEAAWRLHMGLSGWGREGAVQPAAAATIRAEGTRVTLARPAIEEWFLSSSRGLEHGFRIQAPPGDGDPARPLVLDLAVEGSLRAVKEGDGIMFRSEDGSTPVRYGQLRVEDSSGKVVSSSLEAGGGGIRIRIQDEGTAYPLFVDPLITNPVATIDGEHPNDDFGFSVANAGDVDGDGYDDLLVGAPGYSAGGHPDGGRAYVFFGSPGGLVLDLQDTWIADGDHDDSLFGYSVAGVGDINGDAIDDLLIGAPHHDEGGAPNNEGYAFVWYGPLVHGARVTALTAPWRAHSNKPDSDFGYAVASRCDVNNDGLGDILVGSPLYQESGQSNEGWIFLWLGRDGENPADDPGNPSNAWWTAESNQSGAKMGWSVACAGDVDADGHDDVIAGAPYYDGTQPNRANQGRAFVWLGDSGGVNGEVQGTAGNAAWILKATPKNSHHAWSVASAGDVDGNGADDILTGAPDFGSGGAIFLWKGFPGSGLGPNQVLDTDDASWSHPSPVNNSRLGYGVASVADVQGYPSPTLLADAPDYSNGGAVLVWHLCPTGTFVPSANPQQSLYSSDPESVAGGGDFNGDGFHDIVAGLPHYNPGGSVDTGRALVYGGAEDIPAVSVAYPNGGELLDIGNTYTIQWSVDNLCHTVATVDILYSETGLSGPFTTLFTGVPNTGLKTWTVLVSPTYQGAIKVVASGSAGSMTMDVSDAVFTVESGHCLCPTSYCNDVNYRCTFNGNCTGCCHYTCDYDESCTAPEQAPPGAC